MPGGQCEVLTGGWGQERCWPGSRARVTTVPRGTHPQPPGLPGQQRGEPGTYLSPESARGGIVTASRSSLKTHGLQWPMTHANHCPGSSAGCCVVGLTGAGQAKASSGALLASSLVGPWGCPSVTGMGGSLRCAHSPSPAALVQAEPRADPTPWALSLRPAQPGRVSSSSDPAGAPSGRGAAFHSLRAGALDPPGHSCGHRGASHALRAPASTSELGLRGGREAGVSWQVPRSAEGLEGLRAGHACSSVLSLPSLVLPCELRARSSARPGRKQGAWVRARTPRGGNRLLPASLGLTAFNLEFNQCGVSPEGCTLWFGCHVL